MAEKPKVMFLVLGKAEFQGTKVKMHGEGWQEKTGQQPARCG